MEKSETLRRRILGRIGETLFAMWTLSIDTDHPRAYLFAQLASDVIQKAYGVQELSSIDWIGLATHSPLRETLGDADRSTVA